jgi:hypothetical protein
MEGYPVIGQTGLWDPVGGIKILLQRFCLPFYKYFLCLGHTVFWAFFHSCKVSLCFEISVVSQTTRFPTQNCVLHELLRVIRATEQGSHTVLKKTRLGVAAWALPGWAYSFAWTVTGITCFPNVVVTGKVSRLPVLALFCLLELGTEVSGPRWTAGGLSVCSSSCCSHCWGSEDFPEHVEDAR